MIKTAPNKRKAFPTLKRMDAGGPTPWQQANQWANKNQEGISSAAGYGAATVDAFAPVDNYGVRSNGAALGSGALSGAAKGAALGSAIPIIGTAAGAVLGAGIGAVSGLIGNKSAQAKKTLAINASTQAQLSSMEQGSEARIAGDPSLKYGRGSASYYRFGGVMKNSPSVLPRTTKPLPAVQGKPRLMPNITESPNRQMSRMAAGGQVEQLSSQDTAINGPSHENGGVKFPSAGVELEGGETVNNGFVFSKKLGFAKPAEAIARQLGKAEKRPEGLINNSTVTALQRKTELLKAQQEATKQAMGIPSELDKKAYGGPIMPRDTTTMSYNPDKVMRGNNELLKKALPVVNQSILQQRGGTTGVQVINPFAVATPNRSVREFQMGTPGRDINVAPTPAVIPRNGSAVGHYKFGGKMKMADGGGIPVGGDLYPNSTVPYLNVPDFNAPAFSGASPEFTVKSTRLPKPTPVVPGVIPAVKPSTGNQIADGFAKAAPFLSNYYNATQKLPLPPVPIMNDEITPNTVDYSASRNEAVRANRSATESARTNLNSGAAVSATAAANLTGQTRAVSQINEAENNQNAQIRNSTATENAQIRAGNNALQTNYKNSLVERQIKNQSLQSANMANLEEKVQGMARDKKLFDQEGEKTILGFLSNNDSGAGYDAARPILEKHLSKDQLSQMDNWATKMRADRNSERADNMKANKLQLDYLKDKNGTTSGILNGVSAISPGKLKRTGTETNTTKTGSTTS